MAKSKTPITVTEDMFEEGKTVCMKCGKILDPGIKCCPDCGSRKIYTNYDEYVNTVAKYCSKCGRLNDGNYMRCPECGCAHFVSYKQKMKKKSITTNYKSTIRVAGIIADILLVVGLLIFAIWAKKYYTEASWTNPLLFVAIFCGVTILISILTFKANRDIPTVLLFYLDILCVIAFIPLICIKSVAIWGGAIILACTISNLAIIILSTLFHDRDNKTTFTFFLIILFILLIIAFFVLRSYGWERYF